jgi:hypothetical protein
VIVHEKDVPECICLYRHVHEHENGRILSFHPLVWCYAQRAFFYIILKKNFLSMFYIKLKRPALWWGQACFGRWSPMRRSSCGRHRGLRRRNQ